MGKASGMIAIPAKLCSDFILIPGTAIHIALEHTIHFAGIRKRRPIPAIAFGPKVEKSFGTQSFLTWTHIEYVPSRSYPVLSTPRKTSAYSRFAWNAASDSSSKSAG